MSHAQRFIAAIVAVITTVLLVESYGAMVTAARAGGRAIPALWPLGTEALALAMEVSVLEAKRLGQRGVLVLSWVLLVASVALSTLLQVAVAPPSAGRLPHRRRDPGVAAGLVRGAEPALPRPAPRPPRRRPDQAADRAPPGRRAEQQARTRPRSLRRHGRRRRAGHRRPPGPGRRRLGQLRPRPAGRVPRRPRRRPAQRAAAPPAAGPSRDRHGDDLADLPGLRRLVRAAR